MPGLDRLSGVPSLRIAAETSPVLPSAWLFVECSATRLMRGKVGQLGGEAHAQAPDGRAGAVGGLRGEGLQARQPLGKELKQGLARGQADVVAALGRGAAQPRALPARQQHHAQLALQPIKI